MSKKNTYIVRRVIEYSEFFVGEPAIDVRATLKSFNRNILVRMAAILSLHFGNMHVPDDERSLFSESSKKHIPYLNKLFKAYYERLCLEPDEKVEVLTYRTGLEFWRQIFSIRVEEFTDTVEESDIEFLLFKVILTLNEKIVSFNKRRDLYSLDELMFLNGFVTNDSNNYKLQSVLQPQMYYIRQLSGFIPSNEVMTKATMVLFDRWGIKNWQQYYVTIIWLANETDKYFKEKQNGVPIIPLDKMKINDETHLFAPSLIKFLSIEEDDYIPYEPEEGYKSSQLNTDFRIFRSKPFVKLKDGSGYVVINNQFLCERLFNSLYFDFFPLINGKEGSCGFFDYKKSFVEKTLFRNTFSNCIPSSYYTFPARYSKEEAEDPHEPDFYVRTKRAQLIIVECKAIKMNGECRDDGDYARLLDELHEKIVLKTRNLDKNRKKFKGDPEPIGVGQLVHHIDAIEDDTFKWDASLPAEVSYYPMLVFEDVKFMQSGLLSMINRWYYGEIAKNKEMVLTEMVCNPIMVISIDTLYLYDQSIIRRGLPKIIDTFINEFATYDEATGEYHVDELADFDNYLRSEPFNKARDAQKWLEGFLNQKKNNEGDTL